MANGIDGTRVHLPRGATQELDLTKAVTFPSIVDGLLLKGSNAAQYKLQVHPFEPHVHTREAGSYS